MAAIDNPPPPRRTGHTRTEVRTVATGGTPPALAVKGAEDVYVRGTSSQEDLLGIDRIDRIRQTGVTKLMSDLPPEARAATEAMLWLMAATTFPNRRSGGSDPESGA